ncbi:hypothetical protein O6P43_012392 [Quillaja saponaria]|uniref:Uncharacterized protein n=1 Tax=Quillaja saponaria TaxID=32244 RepID=A0AAD7PU28_QUISA|nr:hypothetical protein O6P43_012392 [Quillaja saponaria]
MPTATDPATAKLLETAPLPDGEGASAGVAEMEEGAVAGDGEEDGGDGGESTVTGDGAAAGVDTDEVGAETGAFTAGDVVGDEVVGGAADLVGADAGDCAMV